MNSDDLEKRLERLAWRKAPESWREEILDAAHAPRKAQSRSRNVDEPGFLAWLRLPMPWVAFAGLWALLLVCNFALVDSGDSRTTTQLRVPISQDQPTVWNLQVAELRRSDVEGKDVSSQNQIRDDVKPLGRPRSERRRLLRLGSVEEADVVISVA